MPIIKLIIATFCIANLAFASSQDVWDDRKIHPTEKIKMFSHPEFPEKGIFGYQQADHGDFGKNVAKNISTIAKKSP